MGNVQGSIQSNINRLTSLPVVTGRLPATTSKFTQWVGDTQTHIRAQFATGAEGLGKASTAISNNKKDIQNWIDTNIGKVAGFSGLANVGSSVIGSLWDLAETTTSGLSAAFTATFDQAQFGIETINLQVVDPSVVYNYENLKRDRKAEKLDIIHKIICSPDLQLQRFVAFFTEIKDGEKHLLQLSSGSGDSDYLYYFYTNGFDVVPVVKATKTIQYGAFKSTVSVEKAEGNTAISFSLPLDLQMSFWNFVATRGLGVNLEQGIFATESNIARGDSLDLNFIVNEYKESGNSYANVFVAEDVKFVQTSALNFQHATSSSAMKSDIKAIYKRLRWYKHVPLDNLTSDGNPLNIK